MRLPVNRKFLLLLGLISALASAGGTTTPFYFETPTLAPMNAVVFCKVNPAECQASTQSTNRKTSEADLKKQLNEVNELVNNTIVEDADKRGDPGMDPWLLFPKTGNCADYAVSKRHKLLELGWSPSSLLIANVKTRFGAGHTILVVRTGSEDLVLDSLTKKIIPVSKSGYSWLSIQSPENPNFWYRANKAQPEVTIEAIESEKKAPLQKAFLVQPKEESEEEKAELK